MRATPFIGLLPTVCPQCSQLLKTPLEQGAHAAQHYKVTFSATTKPITSS